MKRIMLLAVLFMACQSSVEKNEEELDRAFKSEYLKNKLEDIIIMTSEIDLASEGKINVDQIIKKYNDDYGSIMGRTNDMDTIAKWFRAKSNSYRQFLFRDALLWHCQDSLKTIRYKAERDSILDLLN